MGLKDYSKVGQKPEGARKGVRREATTINQQKATESTKMLSWVKRNQSQHETCADA